MTAMNHSHCWSRIVIASAVAWAACTAFAVRSAAQTAPGVAAAPAAAASAATGIWSGVYTEAQAKRGEAVSATACVSCHGADLAGDMGPGLVGQEFLSAWRGESLGAFFDRVHATMPADAPGSMSPRDTADVVAYMLQLNKFPAGEKDLPSDMSALNGITFERQPPAK